jgi:3-deoxy-7-phosphoheptulonate synthase
MLNPTDDLRIKHLRPLLPPAILMEELPASERVCATISQARQAIARVLHGQDDRLVLVAGPCSIHDPVAGLDDACKLAAAAAAHAGELLVVMRVYFEKPRTTIGWKGLINDPNLDDSYAINTGLRLARRFLLDVTEAGLPAGTEFLDPITPQFLADLVAWGAIGARTSESQVHRELASGLSMPVGFKNGTDGTVQVAIDGVRSSAHPHHFLSVTKQGVAAIVATRGNPDCHVILRGGASGPNVGAGSVNAAAAQLAKAGLPAHVMVDCSHANSEKSYVKQAEVVRAVAEQVAAGSKAVFGLMMESFLVDGRQDHAAGKQLEYGQSITDACMSWARTEPLLPLLADAVKARRSAR